MSARRPPALMIQGTGSDVGKSLLVAGLARAFTKRGHKVCPFKPQNMSNNAAVTPDGGEIGRAQALQAKACGLPPSRHMNPVLLKPQSDQGAQVVVQGHVLTQAKARDYYRLKPSLLPKVLESYAILAETADLMLVEGAGSPAEVNLRAADIANMGFAEACDLPVILVGDIDRGGVLASIVGTMALIAPSEQARIKGYVINKFRGDASLFWPALDIIKDKTGLDCLGVVPHFAPASLLPAEDGQSLRPTSGDGALRIAVPLLSRIANFDDFDPLAAEPNLHLQMVAPGQPIPADSDLIILPGSKSTIADLDFLRAQGWDVDIAAHLRHKKPVLGICAGFQMLGKQVSDPDGVEGPKGGQSPGLGLLDIETSMAGSKVLTESSGFDAWGLPVMGYEMHMGRSFGPDCARPLLMLNGQPDGAISADGLVMGCYLHGLFASDAFRAGFLNRLRPGTASDLAYDAQLDQVLDQLAQHLEDHLDLDRIALISRS